jgi:PAS domain S-box-containing protein
MSDANGAGHHRRPNTELSRRLARVEGELRARGPIVEALQDSEKRYRRLFESAHDGILILAADTGEVLDVNPFLTRLLGYSWADLRGKHLWDIGAFRDISSSKEAFRALQENDYIRYEDLPLETADGRLVDVEFVSNVYLEDHVWVIQCNIRDISERKRGDAERERLRLAIEQVGEMIVITDPTGTIDYVNPAFERVTGYSRGEVIGRNPRMLKSGQQDDAFYRQLWSTIAAGGTFSGRLVNRRKDGKLFTEEATISPVRDSAGRIVNYVAVKRDITEHLRLASQVQQAQKMESVGRLAGGVAHDFRNMLTVIIGYAQLALDKVDPSLPLHDDLKEILGAANRSSAITRQLLAFARKETISPRLLDVNATVEGMLRMLRSLIGEDIELAWKPGVEVWPVRMDPAQIDQILTNLCVNARDAMVRVGRLTIETGVATFDADWCDGHTGHVAGEFTVLTVTDDGGGMDLDTMDRIFEPFFTTKNVSEGTGLGLATVFGIVKQNDGFIDVSSELGDGTTFRIYLPRHAGESARVAPAVVSPVPRGLGQTVLLVEDEPAILRMGQAMLERLGYKVLAAVAPAEALRIVEAHGGDIDLVVTDVVMAGMNGRDLADRVRTLCPDIRILFISGYTADVIAHRGVLEEGVNFLQKPFSMEDLGARVREVLGEAIQQGCASPG